MNKNCKVVLLPTKDLNGLWSYKGRRLYYNQANFNDETETGYFHMYVLSEKADEKCKFYLDGDLVRPNVVPDKDYWKVRSYPEIIATTNKELQKEGIASIDDDFIEWYCDNPVEEVEVRYTRPYNSSIMSPQILSDGYIVINPVEETWEGIFRRFEIECKNFASKEDIIKLLERDYTPKRKVIN